MARGRDHCVGSGGRETASTVTGKTKATNRSTFAHNPLNPPTPNCRMREQRPPVHLVAAALNTKRAGRLETLPPENTGSSGPLALRQTLSLPSMAPVLLRHLPARRARRAGTDSVVGPKERVPSKS
ncbi:hypothetical protein MRX96_022905 [Rhipicephalus microplus]